VLYAIEKFCPYLCSKIIVYTDHSAFKHLLEKKEAEPCLIRWIVLLQEFNIEIKDKIGAKNVVANHFSLLIVTNHDLSINDAFPDEHLLVVALSETPWFADIGNYLAYGVSLSGLIYHQWKNFFHDLKSFL